VTLSIRSCTYAYRRWARRPVLHSLDYTLHEGVTMLLGPNGAGKSTLLRLAASVTLPQSGTVTLDGIPSGSRAYKRAVGWMPQQITAMTALTAREQVAYTGWLKGMRSEEAWEASLEALARVDLDEEADTRARRLSGGQLRRVGVASALVHGAVALVLDEPTAGMDPRQRRVFQDLLRSLAADVRILVSTHDVADLAEVADHVTLLDQGRITYAGTTADFLAHAPSGSGPGRIAEAAYTSLSNTRH
jgi:ABC-2 type transport system ATP-binding protein